MTVRTLKGDCRVTLAGLPECSVQAVVTSPPYFGLRSYSTPPVVWGGEAEHAHEWAAAARFSESSVRGTGRAGLGAQERERWIRSDTCACGAWLGHLGLEPRPELFIEHLVEVFRGVRRVLRADGVCWLNLGDSYAGSGKGPSNSLQSDAGQIGPSARKARGLNNLQDTPTAWTPVGSGYKPKDLMMLPARVALALQADGWWLRSMIPWIKRNAMPESVTDRPASAVEYWFQLTKSPRIYWDADAVRVADGGRASGNGYKRPERLTLGGRGNDRQFEPGSGRNIRNTDLFLQSWQGLMLDDDGEPLALVVNPAGYKGAHFATFAPKLIEPLIKATTSEKGCCPECLAPWERVTEKVDTGKTQKMADGWDSAPGAHGNYHREGREQGRAGVPVMESRTLDWRPTCQHSVEPVPCTILDPFAGAGTTGLVADRLGRDAILCELSDEYGAQQIERITNDAPLFVNLDVA